MDGSACSFAGFKPLYVRACFLGWFFNIIYQHHTSAIQINQTAIHFGKQLKFYGRKQNSFTTLKTRLRFFDPRFVTSLTFAASLDMFFKN